jgi:hypothetical protein
LNFVFSAKLGSGRHRIEKNQIPAIFHRCEYAVESRFDLKLLALEFKLAPGMNRFAPWIPVRPFQNCWTKTRTCKLGGFSRTVRVGASEK